MRDFIIFTLWVLFIMYVCDKLQYQGLLTPELKECVAEFIKAALL